MNFRSTFALLLVALSALGCKGGVVEHDPPLGNGVVDAGQDAGQLECPVSQSCGACDVVCKSGFHCVSGACEEDPTFFIAAASARNLAVDDTHLYWLSGGRLDGAGNVLSSSVMRATLAGDAVETVVDSRRVDGGFILDGSYIYWGEQPGQGLWRSPKDGSASAEELVAGVQTISLAANETHIFWADDTNASLTQSLKDGSELTVLATGTLGSSLREAAGFVYYNPNSMLTRVANSGLEVPEQLPMLDVADVLWSDQSAVFMSFSYVESVELRMWQLDAAFHSTSLTVLAREEGMNTLGLGGDDTNLYLAIGEHINGQTTGRSVIRRIPRHPAPSSEFTIVAGRISSLVVSDSAVYWTTEDAVHRLPK